MHSLLPLLPKPSRYAGLEEGAVRKDARNVRVRCALAFPDTYEVGMSYLGQKILYGLLNAREDCWAERVFAPCREGGKILKERETPLAALESGDPLSRFDMLGFSITHELCYTNVLYMLDLAGIPLRGARRGDSLRDWPIVMAGGGCALNAEPLAPFMDIMCLGDGEDVLPQCVDLLAKAGERGWTRGRFLAESRHIPGVYVPSLFAAGNDGSLTPLHDDYPGAARRIVPNLDKAFYPSGQVTPIGAVHNRLALEIARGCTRGCRFCQAGMTYRPVRERSLKTLETLVDECLAGTGFDELSFLALSAGDFSALKTLFSNTAERCAAQQVALALPSLRVGSVDDSIMARIAGIRRTGATLAPEAGSQRLRDIINKGVTEEDALNHVRKLMQHGWRQVKLYFMIGLPGETREDLDAIFDLSAKARDAAGRGGPRIQVTAAISPFVPKAHTPFQWEAQLSLEEIRERIGYLIALFKGRKNLKLRWHDARMSSLEGVFSRGDRRLADVLERAYAKGAIFSNWAEGFSLDPWLEALEECGQRMEDWTGSRVPGAPLPWDHLESGVDPAFLLAERVRALAGRPSPDCRYGACLQCGVCDRKNRPSRLGRTDAPIRQTLNFAARDQENHAPDRDGEGRLIFPDRRSAPPRIAPELGVRAVRYRIWHTKEGRSAFLSQLELQTVLERAMRRAGLPLSFSQGFHPLPLLSFGRALPVGVCSRAEWFRITLREYVAPDDLRGRLAPRLPQGMEITRVEAVEHAGPVRQSPSELFRIAHTGTEREREAFLEKWREFSQMKTRVWTYTTKKGERSVDLRALIAKLEYDAGGAALCTTDWSESYLSPLALARAVTGEKDLLKLSIVKLEQYDEPIRDLPKREDSAKISYHAGSVVKAGADHY